MTGESNFFRLWKKKHNITEEELKKYRRAQGITKADNDKREREYLKEREHRRETGGRG